MAARSSERPIFIYAAIGANLAIAVTKLIAAALSRSSSILSEAIHSIVDTADQLLLLLGKRRGARPPDEEHPYGHGKEFYFWSLIVAIVLFGFGGGLSVYEGITHLLHPRSLEDPRWAYVVLAVALVFEASSWTVALRALSRSKRDRSLWRAVRESKDPGVYTVFAEDSAAITGIALAFFGILLTQLTGNPVYDGAASIGIGGILALVSMFLAYEARSLLVGESDPDVALTVRRLAASDPAIQSVGTPLTMHLGPDEVLVNLGVQFRGTLGAAEVARSIDRLERAIRREHPQVTRVFVEAEPLTAASPASRDGRDDRAEDGEPSEREPEVRAGKPPFAAPPDVDPPAPIPKEPTPKRSPLLEHPIAVGLAVIVLVGLARVLAAGAGVLLLGFFAVLLATLLRVPLDFFSRFMPRALALILTLALLAGLGAGIVLLAVPVLTEQAARFAEQLPVALDRLGRWWAQVRRAGPVQGLPAIPSFGREGVALLEKALPLAVSAVTVTGTVVAVFVLALFLAYAPASYRQGVRALVAREHRPLFDDVWGRLGSTLRGWTAGILGAMVTMGAITALGLHLAGIDGWLLLGFLTFLGTFVPYVGAFASAIPGLMVGLAASPTRFLYALVVYGCVHVVEGYVVEPLIMRRAVRLRPALLLFWELFMGAILGLPGIIVATPLLACLKVAVDVLYVERKLGPGRHDGATGGASAEGEPRSSTPGAKGQGLRARLLRNERAGGEASPRRR